MEEKFAKIKALLEKSTEIPTLSKSVLELLSALNNPNVNLEEIARIVNSDYALATRIINFANSPYYGLQGNIKTTRDAITLLGVNMIKNLAMLVLASSCFENENNNRNIYTSPWMYAICVAVISETIAEACETKNKELAFTAGLLHDIGESGLQSITNQRNSKAVRMSSYTKYPINRLQDFMFGFNHCDVGYVLAKKWLLPNELQEVIRYHHDPTLCPVDNNLVDIVHTATVFCSMYGISPYELQTTIPLHTKSFEALGLNSKTLMSYVGRRVMHKLDNAKFLLQAA